MIQTHQQLLETSREYNTLFSKNEFYPIQKAYTTPHYLVLVIRFPGKTVGCYIGRGHGYEGFQFSEKIAPSYLRIQDKFLDYARKYLVGARMGRVQVCADYQSFSFTFKNEHPDNEFIFGYKDHQLFFMRRERDQNYCSWSNSTTVESSSKLLQNILGGSVKILTEQKNQTIEQYLGTEEKKASGKLIQKKKEKFLLKKAENIKKDLGLVLNHKKIEEALIAGEIDLSKTSYEGHGQKIKFTGAENEWQRRDLIFQKIKKLKKAVGILEQRLKETELELENVRAGKFEFELTKEKAIPLLWNNTLSSKKTIKQSEHNVKNFKLKNITGVLALDASSNDFIRSQASKDHWWFHIDQYSGSHLIIKTDDLSQLSQEDYRALGSFLRDSSKLKIESIPLIFSQVKNVKGMKGVQGKVIVSKPKYLQCHYQAWAEIITLL